MIQSLSDRMADEVSKKLDIVAAYQSIKPLLGNPDAVMQCYNGVAEFTGCRKIDNDEAVGKLKLMQRAVDRINGRVNPDEL